MTIIYDKLYNILDVSLKSTSNEIKKAYYYLAKKEHPDKNGDPEKFKEINNAYKILINSEKRKTYDKFGIVDGNGNGGLNIFASFFEEFDSEFNLTTDNIYKNINVSYQDIYFGIKKEINIEKKKICHTCNSTGYKNEKKNTTCSNCAGRGKISQLGNSTITISFVEVPCNSCNGIGVLFEPENICNICKRIGFINENSIYEIEINSLSNLEFVFKGESHESNDRLPGDVIITIDIDNDDRYEKNDLHLLIKDKISFLEAISGNTFIIKHLNGKDLKLKSNKPIFPNTIWTIPGQGFISEEQVGDLYLELNIDYDNININDEQFKILNKIFKNDINNDYDLIPINP